ncbi:hypothetical protein KKA08_00585, partial [bacterium]|nr:hypothetical protein [bacterium]
AFGHAWHASSDGANLTCFECHSEGTLKNAESAKTCDACHKNLIPPNAAIAVDSYLAMGYVEAMHQQCISCHNQEAEQLQKPDLPRCTTCHHDAGDILDQQEFVRQKNRNGQQGSVTIPNASLFAPQ